MDQEKKIIVPHVLCGGSGTRLWPLSRESLPKQFVPLIQGRSLLTCTLERAARINPHVVCIANLEHRFMVDDAARAAGVAVSQVLEPVARNTAAAMACAALLSDPADYLLFLPADHYIPDEAAFAASVQGALGAAESGYLVTFGVTPSAPSTAYGYIRQGALLPGCNGYAVESFVEKPCLEKARDFLLAGGYYWNAGIFLAQAGVLLSALEKHALDIYEACRSAVGLKTEFFGHVCLDRQSLEPCRGQSIDYAVMEQHDRVALIPFNGSWSDVGSWNSVATLHDADAEGNRREGQAYLVDCRNVFVHAPHRPVAALNLDNVVVIDTPDALLVADAASSERVREVVELLRGEGVPQITHHKRTARPWGGFECLDAGDRFQVKRLIVNPRSSLSLQLHNHRAEHWVVVRGTAKVTKGEESFTLTPNESTYIPRGTRHRLENLTDLPLEVIEVQSGDYLGEDDIVRFSDDYGRSQDGRPQTEGKS